jgi:hypothetical protein
VQAALDEAEDNTHAAAAKLCRSLAFRWAAQPTTTTADGLTVTRSPAAAWLTLVAELDALAAAGGATAVPGAVVELDRSDGYSEAQ